MSKSILLARFLTEPTIRVLAGERYYRRGLDYFQRGHVVSIEGWENSIRAVVRGTESYTVAITAKSDRLDFQCDCPVGGDGEFCKHCVAAALAWLDREAAGPVVAPMAGDGGKARRRTKPEIAPRIATKEIARVLRSADKAALIDLVQEWSQEEPGLRAKLTQYAACATRPEAAVRQARLSLEKAIRIRGSVSYQGAGGYAGGVHSAIDLVEKLIGSGHASPAIELCEESLRWLARAVEHIDDSDGQGIELMERLQEIHLRVCAAARPDPVELARRLFRAELLAQYGKFSGSAEKYAGILGAEGLQAFRKLAEAEWANVRVRVPAERLGEFHGKRPREQFEEQRDDFSITSIMISLARQSGDVEQLVSILERNLSHPYRYFEIAEAYRRAGDADKALNWAEKGVAAFPDRPDRRLRLFLAEEYQQCDRHQCDQDRLARIPGPCQPRELQAPGRVCPERRRLGGVAGARLALDSARSGSQARPQARQPPGPFLAASKARPLAPGGDLSLRGESGGGLAGSASGSLLRCSLAAAGRGERGGEAGGVSACVSSRGRGGHRERSKPSLRRCREAVGAGGQTPADAWPERRVSPASRRFAQKPTRPKGTSRS